MVIICAQSVKTTKSDWNWKVTTTLFPPIIPKIVSSSDILFSHKKFFDFDFIKIFILKCLNYILCDDVP